jgi:hypothetical protein
MGFRSARPWRLAVPAAAVLFLWGCGGDSSESTIDSAAVEAELGKAISQPASSPSTTPYPGGTISSGAPALKVSSVTCPNGVAKQDGEAFDCDFEGDLGGENFEGTLEMTEKDSQGQEIAYKGTDLSGPVTALSGTIKLTE